MELQELIERETKPRRVTVWGVDYIIFTPVLLTEKWGDGQKLCYLMSIDSRPYYWLFLVDSNFEFGTDEMWRFIEEELEPAICDEFGCYTDEDREEEGWEEEGENYPIYFRDCSGFFVREIEE